MKKYIYVTIDGFKDLMDDGEYDIIAVKMNKMFLENYDMSSFHEVNIKNSNYYIFNKQDGFNLVGHFSEKLKGEDLVEKVYIISPSLTDVYKNMINEIMTVTEASTVWGLTEGAVRKAIEYHKFKEHEYRKAGRITLVSKEGMERVFGTLRV